MLCNNLAVAKTLTPQCQDTIAAMEARINIYFDNEMTKEIEKYSLFEHLNMEKMTPHFLKLAKCTRRRCGGIRRCGGLGVVSLPLGRPARGLPTVWSEGRQITL